ncbi:hypothetical protein FDP41_007907 [Naegleria fowleri]|uniref:Complex 1 LYR protein domain-containing protein n=1 Tax=Naegleria fowleri TaxID=5763 RepID=A0A6A5CAH3_NAEFO|nr:uncharacterized protein FDP41_007907 [Naegleria fowleri]KAF0983992.1 hypothetical protein FDP41_007907 [Naegleria fowleri]CAG4713831.1 unnamed protein product [Naegleria fowleri]
MIESHSTLDISKRGILSLYRLILREGNQFPNKIQRTFVKQKAAQMFRVKYEHEDELRDAVRLAMTHVDNIRAQVASHKLMYVDDRLSQEDLDRLKKEQEEKKTAQYRTDEAQWDQ